MSDDRCLSTSTKDNTRWSVERLREWKIRLDFGPKGDSNGEGDMKKAHLR